MVENFTYGNTASQSLPFLIQYIPIFFSIIPIIIGAVGGFFFCLISFLKERKDARKNYKDVTLRQYAHEFWICTLVGGIVSVILVSQLSPFQQYFSQYPLFYEFFIGFGSVGILEKIGGNILPSNAS